MAYPCNGKETCLCRRCCEFERMCSSLMTQQTIKCPECEHVWNPALSDFITSFCDAHAPPPAPPKRDSRAADPSTEYAFTLTIRPGDETFKLLEEVARNIMEMGLTNKPYEKACEWAFVLEHTDAGTPHIHGVYRTPSGRRLAAKYFQRYHKVKAFKPTETDPHWWNEKIHLGHGHRGGYHEKARHNESYKAYLVKEGVVVKNAFSPEEISTP